MTKTAVAPLPVCCPTDQTQRATANGSAAINRSRTIPASMARPVGPSGSDNTTVMGRRNEPLFHARTKYGQVRLHALRSRYQVFGGRAQAVAAYCRPCAQGHGRTRQQ